MEVRVTSDVFLGHCPPYCLRQGLPLTLKLTELAGVAGWKVGLRDPLVSGSLVPERQAYTACLHSVLNMVSGNLNSGPHTYVANAGDTPVLNLKSHLT